MDITDAVVTAVDARIKTLTFDRERLDQAARGPKLCSRPRSKRVGSFGPDARPLPRGPMPDPRFFEDLGPATLAELASLSGARLADPADGRHLISHVAPLESADAGAITFFPTQAPGRPGRPEGRGLFRAARARGPGSGRLRLLLTSHPQAAWAAAAERLHAPRRHDGSQHRHPSRQRAGGGRQAVSGRDDRAGRANRPRNRWRPAP
jgi:hypothetical protein